MKSLLKEKTAFTEYDSKWEKITDSKDGKFTIKVKLEPGEKNNVEGNLVIPKGIDILQVYSHFQIDEKHEWPAWPKQTIVNLKNLKGEKMNKNQSERQKNPKRERLDQQEYREPKPPKKEERQQQYRPPEPPKGHSGIIN